MSAQWVRNNYHVPAKRGGRVRLTDLDGTSRQGTITSFSHYVHVRFDGDKYPTPCHPTWNIEYLGSI